MQPAITKPESLDRVQTLKRLRFLANWLDSRFRIPGTQWRFGLDAVLGLLPGVGDLTTAGVALYIVAEARRLGARKRTIARMLFNTGIDLLLGTVPLLGDVIDVAWKANRKNLDLLEAELRQPK